MYGRWLVATVWTAALLAGCGGGSGNSSVHSGGGGQGGWIRGDAIGVFSCTAKSEGTSVRVAPSTVSEIRVCPLKTPVGTHHAYAIERGSPQFAPLVRALAAPDGKHTPGVMCPMYAQLIQPVIADSASGPLLVHVPVDGCGHYLPGAMSALTAAGRR
jgi:hypothetical protein